MKICFTCYLIILTSIIQAQTTICQQPDSQDGIDVALGYHDNYSGSSTNYGTDAYFKAFCIPGSSGGQNTNRSLINFDLSPIPSNATVLSADMYLFATGYINSLLPGHFGNNVSYVQRVTDSWDEMTVTWDTQPLSTTNDEDTLEQSTSSSQDYVSDVTKIAQYMVQYPSQNYGFLFRLAVEDPSNQSGMLFYSSDSQDSTKWPELCVTYRNEVDTEATLCQQPDSQNGIDVALGYHDNYSGSSTNYGTDTYFKAFCIPGSSGGQNSNRSLIKFDLSTIPSNAIILSSDLYLFATGYINSLLPGHFGNNTSYIQRVTDSWDEMIVTWDTQPSTTTNDEDTLEQSTSSSQDYISDVTKIAQYMVQYPSQNYGFLFRLAAEDPNNQSAMLFNSSDSPDSTKWPMLCVTYKEHETAVIEEVSVFANPSALKISPNPTNNYITINTDLTKGLYKLYEIRGQLLTTGLANSQQFDVDMSKYSSGIYFFTLLDENDRDVYHRKIIKE